jgi:hypothetical protein
MLSPAARGPAMPADRNSALPLLPCLAPADSRHGECTFPSEGGPDAHHARPATTRRAREPATVPSRSDTADPISWCRPEKWIAGSSRSTRRPIGPTSVLPPRLTHSSIGPPEAQHAAKGQQSDPCTSTHWVCGAADRRAARVYSRSLCDGRFGGRRHHHDYFPTDWM